MPKGRQDESRSISENSTWGIRRRFEQGKLHINHTKFLGYDKDKKGNLVINEKQAKTVRRIYREFLDGKGDNRIARALRKEKVPKWDGTYKWYETTVRKILENEKYKGDAMLQKTYTVDFLTKKRELNTGQVPQYYVEESHPAIIDKDTWEAVRIELERRRAFSAEHYLKRMDFASEENPFAGKVICSCCSRVYGRRIWSQTGSYRKRKVWQCSYRYPGKGIKGCQSPHLDEFVLHQAAINTFNAILENKEHFLEKWREGLNSENVLKRYKSRQFIGIVENGKTMTEFDIDIFAAMMEKITVYNRKKLMVSLLDGTDIECEIE